MRQTDSQRQAQHKQHCCYQPEHYGDNNNIKERDVPDYPLFSKEWEWEECCHHTIE